jgi:hypothetical protein
MLFLLAFAFPHSSGELSHALAPVVIMESGSQLTMDVLDLTHVRWTKTQKRLFSIFASNVILYGVNQCSFYRKHYATAREDSLQSTGWAAWNGLRFTVMLIKIPLRI